MNLNDRRRTAPHRPANRARLAARYRELGLRVGAGAPLDGVRGLDGDRERLRELYEAMQANGEEEGS